MCFFFFNPSPVRRVPIPTGIQRKLNFVSVAVLGTPGASRGVLEETGEGRGNTHSQVEVILFWVNLKPKPIKPINHEQPTN